MFEQEQMAGPVELLTARGRSGTSTGTQPPTFHAPNAVSPGAGADLEFFIKMAYLPGTSRAMATSRSCRQG